MRIFGGKKIQNFSEMPQNHVLSCMTCRVGQSKNLLEKALGMKMRKLVLGLSLAQILPEKINKIFSSNNPGRFLLVESVLAIRST